MTTVHVRTATALIATLAIALLGGPAAAVAGPSAAGDETSMVSAASQRGTPGFPTPEEAIEEYLAGVADADVTRILGASAIAEMSENFRFDLLTDSIQAFVPPGALAPSEYPLFIEVNKATRTAAVLGQVRNLAYGLLTDTEIEGRPLTGVDKAWADAFVREVDPARLSDLTIVEIRFSDARFADDERYLESAARQASFYGADEQTERLVLASFEGRLYDIGFTLLRYGDRWKVSSQDAVLSGSAYFGTARPTTIEEYDRQTRAD